MTAYNLKPAIFPSPPFNEAKEKRRKVLDGVREVAQEKGISMSKLFRIADVNYKTIQTIWRDPYHGLNMIMLNKIAQALEVPTSELIEDVPDE